MSTPIKQLLRNVLVDYFSLKGYIENQDVIENEIRQGVSFRGTNVVILIMAILVASLGLNTNSTAVIIGAMLISPLMGPIIGIGLAVGIQDFALLKRGLRNLLMAAGVSILASTVFFMISPVGQGHSELLARTSPTIYDVLIAFFGGGAGIVGMSSRSKGNVIPGVAIATALMPPLCTAGYGVATLQPVYFFGAGYLFIINTIFIALATFIGVKLLGFKQVTATNPERSVRVRRWVYTVSILTLLPSIYLTYNMFRASRFQINAERFVTAEMTFPGTEVLGQNTRSVDGVRTLTVTLIGRTLPADSLRAVLTPRLAQYGLKGVQLNIVQGGDGPLYDARSAGSQSVSQVYEAAQQTLLQRQNIIDSLQNIVAQRNRRDTIGCAMAPELKIVFPQLRSIAVSSNVICNIDNGHLDTVEIALVHIDPVMPETEYIRLKRYLEARLGVGSVSVIPMP